MAKKHVKVSLRKPPSPEKLDAFVAASAETQSATPSPQRSRRAHVAPAVTARMAPTASVAASDGAPAVAVEGASVEKVHVEATSVETASVETASVEATSVETASVETASVETATAVDEKARVAASTAAPGASTAEAAATTAMTHETSERVDASAAAEVKASVEAPAVSEASSARSEAAVSPDPSATTSEGAPTKEGDGGATAETAAGSAEPSRAGGAPDPVTPSPEPPVVDATGRTLMPVTVYLPQPLAERLAMHCIAQDRDMSNVIGEALEQHLSRRLGAGSWSSGFHAADDKTSDARGAGSSRWEDPRRWAESFRYGSRMEQVLQVGRVLVGLWQKRPWAA
ncbi:hypothetical protein [Chondromyces crocatus]|uniref:Uncharacterized protein n=1 Tax=Chondromyces crocatus TaxID=52 RepID=A0A0K1E731_CHOCO|nr:hypothetical protein [Chondromyces crocatus]AKT36383.1 uncharacterized protein CMC5_004960 [Chondromyces crocatus]